MENLLRQKKIGFIGTGNMAFAICEGLLRSKIVPPENISGSDVTETALKKFQSLAEGIRLFQDNKELVKNSDILVLSIKPQQADIVLGELADHISNKLIVSIMAGKTMESIASSVKQRLEKCKVIRVMPNTPLMCGLGASAIVGSPSASPQEIELVKQMFACSGEVALLTDENLLDPITALSGSGPAYVFAFIEALASSAEKLGIPKNVALRFAIQTVYGSGKLASDKLQSNNTHPSQLREMVTSKGGTTEAALNYFKSKDLDGMVHGALQAAVRRAEQLSKL